MRENVLDYFTAHPLLFNFEANPPLFQFHNGHAALALTIAAKAEGFDPAVGAQVLLDGVAQRAGAVAVSLRLRETAGEKLWQASSATF